MALSPEVYRERSGLPEGLSSKDTLKHLLNMIKVSIGPSSVGQVVEVLGTVETQDLRLVVTPLTMEVTS